MLRASSCTFFSSVFDSLFVLKVMVRSLWQWLGFVLMFSSCLKSFEALNLNYLNT